MLPEFETVLNDIVGYYKMGLQKRYPPEPEPVKQNEPAPKAQSGPAQGDKDVLPPEKELTADQKALVELTPEEQKNLCLSALAGSMEKLPKDDPDYKECSFLSHSLKNGWLVDDIPLLRNIYTMRENNYLKKELSKERNEVHKQDNPSVQPSMSI